MWKFFSLFIDLLFLLEDLFLMNFGCDPSTHLRQNKENQNISIVEIFPQWKFLYLDFQY